MTNTRQAPIIVWFRRDLRLSDNLALIKAVEAGAPVVCLYVRDPTEEWAGANGAAQAWWLYHSLTVLDAALRKRGNRLLTMTGDPRHLIAWLAGETGAQAVFWNRRYDVHGRALDSDIKSQLKEMGLRAESSPGFLLHDPTVLKTKQGKHFSVYTPFWKAFESSYSLPDAIDAPKAIASATVDLECESIASWKLLPENPDWASGFSSMWTPGEDGARAAIGSFLDDKLERYGGQRDYPAQSHTSRLSPHLAFGEIAPHALWRATQTLGAKADTDDVTRFRKEIVWRDFAWHTLFHNPRLDSVNLNRRFDNFPWEGSTEHFRAWTRGQTGYPIVDAGMRELWQTGTMHNRVRMIAASFLIKDLLIDWRDGEKWFRDTLVDADAASNPFNWQWVAGCGADASPFFRIFNPILQGEKFDSDGGYVRRWCPELARLPDKWLHRPFEAEGYILKNAGVELGGTYPRPIVDHAKARDAALEALKTIRRDDAEV
jgi:deoxyribodipyrimidine photo-lyase